MYRILIPLGLAVCAFVLSGCTGAGQGTPSSSAPPDPATAQRATLTAYVNSVNAWDREDDATLERTLALVTSDWAQFERGEFRSPTNTSGRQWSLTSVGPVDGYPDGPALGMCLDTGDGAVRPLIAFFEAASDAPHGWRLAMLLPGNDFVTCD